MCPAAYCASCKNVIAKPVRTLAVAIRNSFRTLLLAPGGGVVTPPYKALL